jgi:hypothetical protein
MKKLLFASPIGRWLFLFRLLVLSAIGELVYYALHLLIRVDMRQDREIYPFWLIIAFCVYAAIPAMIYVVAYVAMPRFQSIGLNRWLALLLLIPVNIVRGIVILFLLLWPPNRGEQPPAA